MAPQRTWGGATSPSCFSTGAARLDVFAAAMLGQVDIVRAVIDAFPATRDAKGPHGIPLIEHAKQGGAEAHAVVELLERAAV